MEVIAFESSIARLPRRPQQQQVLPLQIVCKADRVSVFVQSDDGCTLLTQMEEFEPDVWRVNLRLPSGKYKYRFYAVNGDSITYCTPNDFAPVQMDGIDGVFRAGA